MPERENEMSLREALTAVMSAEGGEQGAAVPEGGEQGVSPAEGVQGGAIPGEIPAEGSPVGAAEPVGETAPAVPEAVPNSGAQSPAAGPTDGMPSQSEMWQAMRELMAENRRLSAAAAQSGAQVQEANGAMRQQSEAAEGAIMRQFTPEAAIPKASEGAAASVPPALNMQELSYLPPDEQQARLAAWQQESMNYAIRTAAAQLREEITRDMAPVKEDYEAKRRIAENDAAKAVLFGMPQFADMKEKEGDIENIIANTPILGSASPEQRYMLAALISRGMRSGRQMTTEELIEKALANPDVMKALEARRVAQIRQNNASLPKVVPSSGLGNANAVPESKPKNMEDVAKAFMQLY